MLRLQPHSLSTIGEVCNASKQSVRRWIIGEKLPEEQSRRALQSTYGIPIGAWGRPALNDDDDQNDDDDDDQPAAPEDGAEIDIMVELVKLARQQRRAAEDKQLTARERQAAQAELSRTLQTLAKLRREAELSESLYVRQHPEWLRLKKAILTALLPHKEAARDVEAAIRDMDEPDDEGEELET